MTTSSPADSPTDRPTTPGLTDTHPSQHAAEPAEPGSTPRPLPAGDDDPPAAPDGPDGPDHAVVDAEVPEPAPAPRDSATPSGGTSSGGTPSGGVVGGDRTVVARDDRGGPATTPASDAPVWGPALSLARLEIPRPPGVSATAVGRSTVAVLVETTNRPGVVRLWLSALEIPVSGLLPMAQTLRTAAARAERLSSPTQTARARPHPSPRTPTSSSTGSSSTGGTGGTGGAGRGSGRGSGAHDDPDPRARDGRRTRRQAGR